MGADAVIAFYGIRLRVPHDDEGAIAGLEARTDPRLVAARKVRLDSWWGRLTDGADYHLLIGKRLGVFGSENDAEKQMTLQELSALAAQTDTLLKDGGFVEIASLVFQLEAHY